jgi:hypothetical protein
VGGLTSPFFFADSRPSGVSHADCLRFADSRPSGVSRADCFHFTDSRPSGKPARRYSARMGALARACRSKRLRALGNPILRLASRPSSPAPRPPRLSRARFATLSQFYARPLRDPLLRYARGVSSRACAPRPASAPLYRAIQETLFWSRPGRGEKVGVAP